MQLLHKSWWVLEHYAPMWTPLVSGLVAGLAVKVLTQSSDRDKWLVDCKKQEFRELLSAISEVYVMTLKALPSSHVSASADEKQRARLAEERSVMVMRDRLYIEDDLPMEPLVKEWMKALAAYAQNRDFEPFKTCYKALHGRIVDAANRCAPKKPLKMLFSWW